jgi:hypothetical protein
MTKDDLVKLVRWYPNPTVTPAALLLSLALVCLIAATSHHHHEIYENSYQHVKGTIYTLLELYQAFATK